MTEELLTMLNAGVQVSSPQPEVRQIVYLDFDGESTRYAGELAQFDVTVADSGLQSGQIAEIIAQLNSDYAGRGVVFTAARPENGDYSTVYVGKTSDIQFAGLAETIDAGNQIKNDNAFVNLDSTDSLEEIISTIGHEVEHIVFGLDHGGEGLAAYAGRIDIWNEAVSEYAMVAGNNYYLNDTKKYSSTYSSSPASNAVIDGGTLMSGAMLYVSSGGTATNIVVAEGASLVFQVESNTVFQGTSAGEEVNMSNGYISGYTINGESANGAVNIQSGGVAEDITCVNGWLRVSSGGTLSGGYVTATGRCSVLGGNAVNLELEDGAYFMLSISSDTTLSLISAGSAVSATEGYLSGYRCTAAKGSSWLYITSGGRADDSIIESAGWFGVSGGIVKSTTLNNGGKMDVRSGGIATDTEVNSGGTMTISNTASTASNTIIHSGGIQSVGNSGIVRDTTVESGGALSVVQGTITGELQLTSGATVSVNSSTIIDFDVSDRTTADESLISDYSLINGAANASYTITVGGDQADGSYRLADHVSSFGKTITVGNGTSTLGSLTVGSSFDVGGATYTLNLIDSTLTLDITSAGVTAKSDINGNGISDVLFQYTGGNGQLGFWMDGTTVWQGDGTAQPADWDVAGAYDMDGSGKADVVMIGNVTVDGIDGAFVGYYAEGNTADWQNIGYLTKSTGVNWQFSVGNLTGGDKNSIVWHSTELGVVGAWTDGTDAWVTIGVGYDSNWAVAGLGDFNGDGKDSVLMSYANGAKYYAVDLDGTATELATADSGWQVVAIGDLAGDGKDDIILFHEETGLLATWSDGSSGNWSTIGQLNAADWSVCGAGDYNGDGLDDLLVRQTSTGTLGYYADGDVSKWNAIGNGIGSDWTVIA